MIKLWIVEVAANALAVRQVSAVLEGRGYTLPDGRWVSEHLAHRTATGAANAWLAHSTRQHARALDALDAATDLCADVVRRRRKGKPEGGTAKLEQLHRAAVANRRGWPKKSIKNEA